MTSSYTPNKKIEKPAYNDYASNPTGWSGPVNTDWDIIDQALGTTTTITVSSSATPPIYVLADTEYRSLAIVIGGTINADITVQIPSAIGGMWVIRNATTDGTGGPWNVYITSGGGGTFVPASRGYTTTIYSDGTNVRYADSRLSTAAGYDRQVQFNNNGVLGATTNFVLSSSDNLGVGTASPASKLTISSGSLSSGSYSDTFDAISGTLPSTIGQNINLGSFTTSTGSNSAHLSVHANRTSAGTNWTTASIGISYDVDSSVGAGGSIWFYNGKVGVGTTQPNSAFDVRGDVSIPNGTILGSLAATTTGSIGLTGGNAFAGGSGGAMALRGYTNGYNNGGMEFYYGNGSGTLEAMRIDSNGNVGINGISPGGNAKLYVNGDMLFPSNVGTGSNLWYDSTVSGFKYVANGYGTFISYNIGGVTYWFRAGNNTSGPNALASTNISMALDSNGNLGIGNSTPQSKLDVAGSTVFEGDSSGYAFFASKYGTTAFGANYDRLELRLDVSNPVAYFGTTYNGTATPRSLAFITGSGGERMRIDTNGNVGVGISSPSAKLNVSSNSTYGGVASTTFLATSGSLSSTAGQQTTLGSFGAYNGNNSYLSTRIYRVSTGSDWTSTAMGITYDVDATVGAGGGIWLKQGNVGIGSTNANPAYKLDVDGTVYSRSGGYRFPDGTTQTTAAVSTGGTVTSVATGTGLTGGTITGSGTISMNTTVGAVGTYALLLWQDIGYLTPGQTADGSKLYYSSVTGPITGTRPTGTWQVMGEVDNSTSLSAISLWMRIA